MAALPAIFRDARVLVLDENVTNRSLVCKLLRSAGCRPEVPADGGNVLTLLRQTSEGQDPFRLVVIELSLPGTAGDDFVRQIAAELKLRQTPLLLMTTLGQPVNAEQLQSLGFAEQLLKPVWERNLVEALQSLANKGSDSSSTAGGSVWPRLLPRTRHCARILVAEDNPTNQAVAAAILKKLGFKADLAANGLEAIKALCDFDYDAVLMDCEMPEMDGYEAARRIRTSIAGVRNHRIPIIALTADAVAGDRERCLEAGMNDYLAKPVEPHRLADILDKWILMNAESRQAPVPPATAEQPKVFNSQSLLDRLMGDGDLAKRVVAKFLSDAPAQLTTLKESVRKGDAREAGQLARTLKGASATVGAKPLSELCGKAQQAAADKDLAAAQTLLPLLDEQLKLLTATLKQTGWV